MILNFFFGFLALFGLAGVVAYAFMFSNYDRFKARYDRGESPVFLVVGGYAYSSEKRWRVVCGLAIVSAILCLVFFGIFAFTV